MKHIPLTLILLALAFPAGANAHRPPENAPVDAPTRFQVQLEGWQPDTCTPAIPLDAKQPLGIIITGTTTVYRREVLAYCEQSKIGVLAVFTSPLTGIAPGEPIAWWIKGRFSHMSDVGTGIAGETITTTPLRAGDFNNDNRVDVSDFSILAQVYGMDEADAQARGLFSQWYYSNINRDLIVDTWDFSLMKRNYGQAGR